MRRLAKAGFGKDFVSAAILPDWWQAECSNDPGVLPDIELRVARFLGESFANVRDPAARLVAPAYAGAQLRQVRDIDRDRLEPAIHTALAVAKAVARSIRQTTPHASIPPKDAIAWRQELLGLTASLSLPLLLEGLLRRGIAVIPLLAVPKPKFQGLACVLEGRPFIVLGYRHDDLGRTAHVICHEVGHIAAGDCGANSLIVDADDEVVDGSPIEIAADLYALRVLTGSEAVPELAAQDFRSLAEAAYRIEVKTGMDASIVIATWAKRTRNYAMATLAIKALYRHQGARRLLLDCLRRFVDVEGASESDRDLLRCVFGADVQDGTAA